MYGIDWTPKASRQLAKIGDRQTREKIYDAVDGLKKWPACRNIKPLADHEHGYRLRVGRYRVLFDVHTTVSIIEIQEVKKRDERTY